MIRILLHRWMPAWALLALLSGCSNMQSVESKYASRSQLTAPPAAVSDRPAGMPETSDDMLAALYQQHEHWQGTPYVLGGNNHRGIDCSGFVQQTFRQQFDVWVPRTTLLQSRVGRAVAEGDWQPGDLVLFKTGFDTRHVGLYLQDGDFLHASTNVGVTISNLKEPYWREHYWQARRLP